jgi:hypothetical protein
METRSNFGSQKLWTIKIRNDNEDSYASINLPLTLSLSMAFDNELIDSNLMRRVRLLKESPSRERFITAEEEKRLFAQLTGRRDHIRSVVTISLTQGCGAERFSGCSRNT